ncbi:uncharacterized protein ARMOST_17242 [Armillaria ostoyae]|uniref:Uncharacterized protein n=1 Tax=Armillaria ostoyae TaxID=47428 RepID=A0A284RYF8_ARMOS|nr:uncharacterized protein ARMOST_17242 [Armillaria ostoyae]
MKGVGQFLETEKAHQE